MFDADLDTVNTFFCNFDLYFVYVNTIMCLSLLVLISMDRLVSIAYPNRFKFLKTMWFKLSVLAVIIVYSFLVNLMLPLNTEIVFVPMENRVIKMCTFDMNVFTKQSWINVGHNVVLIFLINNGLIIKLVWFITSSRRKIANNSSNSTKTSSKDRKFAISAIGLSLVAFVCKLPLNITIIVTSMIDMTDFDMHFGIIAVTLAILGLENAASFYVNMALNSVFYQEVRLMIGLNAKMEFTNTNTAEKNTNKLSNTKSTN